MGKQWKKREALIPLAEFKEYGDSVEGKVLQVRPGETQYGEANFAIIQQANGEKVSLCISSAMALHDWDELVDQEIRIVYTEDKPSAKRKGKEFKVFELFVKE
jgi:hypothetical protein